MTTTANTVLAGNRITVTWPITLADGDLIDLNATVLVVDRNTGTIIDTITPTVTPDDTDPAKGTISTQVEFGDDMSGPMIVRLDGDDNVGDVLAAQVQVHVTAAAAQRP